MRHKDNNIDDLFRKQLGNKEMNVSNIHFPSEHKSTAKNSSSHFSSYKGLVKSIGIGGSILLIVIVCILFTNKYNTKDSSNSNSVDSVLIEKEDFTEDTTQIKSNASLHNEINNTKNTLTQPVIAKKEDLPVVAKKTAAENKSILKKNRKDSIACTDTLCTKDSTDTALSSVFQERVFSNEQAADKTELTDSIKTMEPEKIPQQDIPADSIADNLNQEKRDKDSKTRKNRAFKKLR